MGSAKHPLGARAQCSDRGRLHYAASLPHAVPAGEYVVFVQSLLCYFRAPRSSDCDPSQPSVFNQASQARGQPVTGISVARRP